MASKEKKLAKSLVSFTGLLILLAILILINALFSYASLRWDATDENVYSLSNGTKDILADLIEPVTFKVFYSSSEERMPIHMKAYARRVIEFLEEYEQYSGGMVQVEVYDPKPDTDEEEWADKYGIETKTTGGQDRIYLGMVAVAADQEETIAFLDPSRERLLEYDITRMIVLLQSPEKKTVGIISGLPIFGQKDPRQAMMQQPGQPPEGEWFFITELKQTYNVKEIPPDTQKIDDDVDLLILFYPKRLGWKAPYAVDQYVLAGGKLIVYSDPLCVSDPQSNSTSGRAMANMTLQPLLKGWGVEMAPEKAVADLDQGTRVRNRFNVVEENPMWITIRGDSLSSEDVITANLDSLLLPVVGAFSKAENFNADWEVLVESSANSEQLDAFTSTLGARTIRQDFVSGDKKLPLAVKISGRLSTAFPQGPPPDPNLDDPPAPDLSNHMAAAKAAATVIVVGDADNLADAFYLQKQNFLGSIMVQMFNDNLNLALNACELLTGGEQLISIRSRGKFERPFTKVMELEREAQTRWLEKEKTLMARMEELSKNLEELEKQKGEEQRLIVSPQQEAEIEKFKEERREINKELKEVRKKLRADIDRLGYWLKFINIFLVGLIVALFGVGFGLYRQKKSKRN